MSELRNIHKFPEQVFDQYTKRQHSTSTNCLKYFRILNNELRSTTTNGSLLSPLQYLHCKLSDLQIMRMRNWHITWFLNKHLSWVLKRTVSPFRWDGSFEHPKHMFELESHAKLSFVSKLEIWQLSVFTCRCQLRGTSHVSGSPVFFFWMHVGHVRIQRGSNFDNVFYFFIFFSVWGEEGFKYHY